MIELPVNRMFALITFHLIVWALWACAAVWLCLALLTLRNLARTKPLEIVAPNQSARAKDPFVSILVPARNEEHRVLADSVRSMLAQDYQPFEVIAVDDRSTDATGMILHAIARADERLIVVDGEETAEGWLGKPYALQQALDRARGEWVLATDADMIFHEAALRTAIELAITKRYDAVTLVPFIETRTFWERVIAPIFGWFMSIGLPIERVNDPRRSEAVAVGGFFLIRRAELKRLGEYRAVRAEVAEDLRMAQLMKQARTRLRIDYAPALISTRMYDGLPEIWAGFSKNFFAGMQFSVFQTAMSVAGVLLGMVAPVVTAIVCAIALASGASSNWIYLFLPSISVWLLQIFTFIAINRSFGLPKRYAFTVPLGLMLFVAILSNSAFRIASGRGVVWKDRNIYERASTVRPSRNKRPDRDFSNSND